MVSFTYFFAFCFGYVRWRIFAWEHFFLNWCLGIKNGNKLLYESEINRLFHTILKQYLESYVTVMENAEWAINKLGFIWYNFPEFYNFLFSVFQCFDTCFIGIEGSKNCFTRNIVQTVHIYGFKRNSVQTSGNIASKPSGNRPTAQESEVTFCQCNFLQFINFQSVNP